MVGELSDALREIQAVGMRFFNLVRASWTMLSLKREKEIRRRKKTNTFFFAIFGAC